MLLISANLLKTFSDILNKIAFKISLTFLILISVAVVIKLNPKITNLDKEGLFNYSNTIPTDVNNYVDEIPKWVSETGLNETNYRFDSFNQEVNQWWNSKFNMPATRGYSNSPSADHAAWLYYLQVATGENTNQENKELIYRKTHFLLDHYGVELYDNSGKSASSGVLGYDQTILDNPNIIKQNESARELNFFEISKEFVTPIIYPSPGIPVLIVSGNYGYETMVKAISLTGLVSNEIIPIKAVEEIDKISDTELNKFPALILYKYKGSYEKKVNKYTKNGGKVYLIKNDSDLPKIAVDKKDIETINSIKENLVTLIEGNDKVVPNFNLKRPYPEKINLIGENLKGIYFKENYNNGWVARINNSNIPIYKAGPAFMYIPIPKNLQNQKIEVNITFTGNKTTWVVFLISTISLAITIIYLLLPQKFRRYLMNHHFLYPTIFQRIFSLSE